MKIDIKLENSCENRKSFCEDCNNHFIKVRPFIKNIVISKHFIRDLKDEEKIKSIVKNILSCSNLEFNELHKFEENIDGDLIFRAKKEDLHVIYCVDKNMRIIFLRAVKNFNKYKKFLENKKEIKKVIESSI